METIIKNEKYEIKRLDLVDLVHLNTEEFLNIYEENEREILELLEQYFEKFIVKRINLNKEIEQFDNIDLKNFIINKTIFDFLIVLLINDKFFYIKIL